MSRLGSASLGEQLRRRFGNDRAFVGGALGVAGCFPISLVVTGPFDREPTSAVNLAVIGLNVLVGIVIAAARPVRSDAALNKAREQAGGRSG